jgi:ribose transport system substrate-binding protein
MTPQAPGFVLAGLGPHGESPASADELILSDAAIETARERRFSVAIVLHTTKSDWASQQLAGITTTLAGYGGTIMAVVDCEYRADRQIEELRRITAMRPDAVISIPVDNVLTADAYRKVGEAGIKLVLMDNAPIGMRAGKDYVTVVSSDNFGNGQVAAAIISDNVPPHGVVGIIGFGVEYYVTKEREIGFRKWMGERRPDVTMRQAQFTELPAAGQMTADFLALNHDVDALFVVWDEPAMIIARTLRSIGRTVPMVTIDLGNDVAREIARGDIIKGVGAQRPYDLGVAEARGAIIALTGGEPPPWIANPALSVTRANILDAYEAVWRMPAPTELRDILARTT